MGVQNGIRLKLTSSENSAWTHHIEELCVSEVFLSQYPKNVKILPTLSDKAH